MIRSIVEVLFFDACAAFYFVPEFPNLLKNNDFNEEKEASQDTKGGEKWNKIMGCHTFER